MKQMTFELVANVVVVEDDPTFLKFWGRIMDEIGVKNYRLFSDSDEALAYLKEAPCSLLISDVIMTKINGYDLARKALKLYPGCNVILTTAYSTDLSRFLLADQRFHLLHKPYTDLAALKRFIKHIINGDTSFDDISEDSFSKNEDFPQVMEWKL